MARARRMRSLIWAMRAKRSVLGIAEHLEFVAAGCAVFELEGVQGHPVAEQVNAEMELMRAAGSVAHLHRVELDVLEVEVSLASDFLVEAAAAEEAVAGFHRAVVDAVADGDLLA